MYNSTSEDQSLIVPDFIDHFFELALRTNDLLPIYYVQKLVQSLGATCVLGSATSSFS